MDALPAHEGTIERALSRIGKHAAYVEAVAESSSGSTLRLDRSQCSPVSLPVVRGVGFRAWCGAGWLDAATGGLDDAAVDAAAAALAERVKRHPGGGGPPGTNPSGRLEERTRSVRVSEEVALEEKVELARHIHEVGLGVPGVQNTIVNIASYTDERLFLASSGGRRHQVVDRTNFAIIPLAMENGKVEFDLLLGGKTAGWELLQDASDAKVQESARTAVALLKAGSPPSGAMPVLLDPSTAGTFAHESFGHGTEADQFLRERSYLKPHLGERVGPECLTLVDDGTIPGAWGSIFFDDEGTPSHRTVMVDQGLFVEVLHDRQTAAALKRAPTGNARRADFLSREFVRMTNTLVDPGDWTVEELVEEAKDGVLLEVCTSGMEDPLGGQMQIKVKRGRLIEKGELGPPIGAMALSGRVLDFLKAVKGVGKPDQFDVTPGWCGKGHTDHLPAGTGGSYLLSHAIVGPT
jgi:TldD protein